MERRQRAGHAEKPCVHGNLHQVWTPLASCPRSHHPASHVQGGSGHHKITEACGASVTSGTVPFVGPCLLRILRQQDDGRHSPPVLAQQRRQASSRGLSVLPVPVPEQPEHMRLPYMARSAARRNHCASANLGPSGQAAQPFRLSQRKPET